MPICPLKMTTDRRHILGVILFFLHIPFSSSLARRDVAASRREILAGLGSLAFSSPAQGIDQCKRNSHNCINVNWGAPSSLDNEKAVARALRDALETYPQRGQAGADCNGWNVVSDKLEEGGELAVEFKSCVGPAALTINLGQPFIDDLRLKLEKIDGRFAVSVRSNSRMGSGDLEVNRKRLVFLGRRLKEEGWEVPMPKYAYEQR
ncbi:hypothetical protein THAOC_03618 [Thalassiosira oceanica]|uniref:Uncharacterized protein n=1 Tax=Thalassiosira oceanica TaxID=159749 RepID=K0TB53_THAOC|nr:hypothetical protein THAOC_03618 [Thalassiosira oceanica]|eukprot:EJK74690.1 hypothetical protein THAOC_03618 [Thalassiosira oceanica]